MAQLCLVLVLDIVQQQADDWGCSWTEQDKRPSAILSAPALHETQRDVDLSYRCAG